MEKHWIDRFYLHLSIEYYKMLFNGIFNRAKKRSLLLGCTYALSSYFIMLDLPSLHCINVYRRETCSVIDFPFTDSQVKLPPQKEVVTSEELMAHLGKRQTSTKCFSNYKVDIYLYFFFFLFYWHV